MKNNNHRLLLLLVTIFLISNPIYAQAPAGYKLVWADEFNKDGAPNPANWTCEKGFVRNGEDQWYQSQNAYCKNGFLILEGRRETKPNPTYVKGSKDWTKGRKTIHYTSASLISQNKQQWQYGHFVMRGRIDVAKGSFPAWWTVGVSKEWPANGEIDMMEFYQGKILANIANLDSNKESQWFGNTKAVDSLWASQFHIWVMDWDAEKIVLSVDDSVLLDEPVSKLENKDGSHFNPFKQPHYMFLNYALGGSWGGGLEGAVLPKEFEVDYIRVYQKEE